jgi:hypothetical protein
MDKVIYVERMLSIYILECKPISFYKDFTIVSSVTGVKVFYNILINAATPTIMWHFRVIFQNRKAKITMTI